MIRYDMGLGVFAASTNIGDEVPADVITPELQAHSTRSALIPQEKDTTNGVDALITCEPMMPIGVRTADCVPILIYDVKARVVAAIHSGWKGTVGNVIGATIARMEAELGCIATDMRAVIGPCIRLKAFEVGDEVEEHFVRAGYGKFCERMKHPEGNDESEKWHVDLAAICREQLTAGGVEAIEDCGICTWERHEEFYSYRRTKDDDKRARIVTYIMLMPE